MRYRSTLGGFAVIVSSFGCQADAPRLTPEHAVALEDSVTAALGQFQERSAAADWEGVAGFYSNDPSFRVFENGALRYESAADILAALNAFPEGMTLSTEYRDTHVAAVQPGIAVMSTFFESTLTDPGGNGFSFGGATTMLWVHETGGWRILRGHTSAPVSRE